MTAEAFEAVRAAIENRFVSLWASRTPVAYGNVQFNPPNPPQPFVRLAIQEVPALQASLGPNPLNRYPGLIYVMIFTENGYGESPGRKLAEQAAPIFRQTTFSGIVCELPYLKVVGPEDQFYHMNLICPYRMDVGQ